MTTHRHDPDATPGHPDEFWGEQTEWTQREPSAERRGFGVTIGRWWDALLGGGAVAGRAHGRAGVSSPSDDELERGTERQRDDGHAVHERVDDEADAWTDEAAWTDGDDAWTDGDDAWTLESEPQPRRHPGVDPLLARLGGLAVIVTLAAPLVVGFTASGSEAQSADALATISSAPASDVADRTATAVAEGPAAPAATATAPLAAPTSDATASGSASTSPRDETDSELTTSAPSPAVAAALQAAPDSEPVTTPAVTTPPCGARYELAAGDYWIRIADAAGVSLAELLEVNGSSVDTVLVPGRSICLPVGAVTPASPSSAAPTSAPTAPATTSTPNRPPTTVTPVPATTVAPRPAAVPQSQAAAIIRDVWPDELEERALEIAWRESNHRSNVNNYCCYGLFQIHWEAHRSWLATIGVTSVSQLFDPVVNANAAYTLYQRAGGFGPWGG